eukprot:3842342-Ditylum_brightwellii.AAC.2
MEPGSEEYERQLAYLKEELDGATPLSMPKDKPVAWICSNKGGMTTFTIDAETTKMLRDRLSLQGCTQFIGGAAFANRNVQ